MGVEVVMIIDTPLIERFKKKNHRGISSLLIGVWLLEATRKSEEYHDQRFYEVINHIISNFPEKVMRVSVTRNTQYYSVVFWC